MRKEIGKPNDLKTIAASLKRQELMASSPKVYGDDQQQAQSSSVRQPAARIYSHCTESEMGWRYHVFVDGRRLALSGRRH